MPSKCPDTETTVCSWVGEPGGKNNACNANGKPASTLPPPAGLVRRGSHEGVYGN